MSRILLQYVLPLLLPTVLYLLWWWTVGHRRARAAGKPAGLARGPWFWLILGGCGLLAAVLVHTALTSGQTMDGQYVPPHVEDGRIVPGHMERGPRP